MPSPAASLEADDGDRTRDPQLGKVTLDGVKKCHEATKPHAQALRPLRVIQASVDSELPGLIGLEARPFGMPGPDPSFFVSTATRNLRRDTKGDLLGDQLFCAYPPPDLENANLPSLAYALPASPNHLSRRERFRDALRRGRTRVFHRKVRPTAF
jgi:hypothetical protein